MAPSICDLGYGAMAPPRLATRRKVGAGRGPVGWRTGGTATTSLCSDPLPSSVGRALTPAGVTHRLTATREDDEAPPWQSLTEPRPFNSSAVLGVCRMNAQQFCCLRTQNCTTAGFHLSVLYFEMLPDSLIYLSSRSDLFPLRIKSFLVHT